MCTNLYSKNNNIEKDRYMYPARKFILDWSKRDNAIINALTNILLYQYFLNYSI
jgi:hypothetical protein